MLKRCVSVWMAVFAALLAVAPLPANEPSLATIPRIDVHAHCGSPEQMERYIAVSDSLREAFGEQLVAWVDLSFRRNAEIADDEYLHAAFDTYQGRFLPCLYDAVKDGLQYGPDDITAWKERGIGGLKIWVGVSDAIDRPEHDPLFRKMAELGFPGASIHIAQPYPTSWCEDAVAFWRAQNAWERVLDRHPNLLVVNAHMLDHFNSDEQLDYLDYMLTCYPKLHVDLAARFQQFHRMSREKLRDFIIRHDSRILFGTDIGQIGQDSRKLAEQYHRCFQLLETDAQVQGAFFDLQQDYQGLALPKETLEKIYFRNALRIYPGLETALRAMGCEL